MVAGWPDDGEGHFRLGRGDAAGGLDGGARREASRVPGSGGDVGVRVEPGVPVRVGLAQEVQEWGVMDGEDLRVGGWDRRDLGQVVARPVADPRRDGCPSIGPLRMAMRRVRVHRGIGEEPDRTRHQAPRRRAIRITCSAPSKRPYMINDRIPELMGSPPGVMTIAVNTMMITTNRRRAARNA